MASRCICQTNTGTAHLGYQCQSLGSGGGWEELWRRLGLPQRRLKPLAASSERLRWPQ